MFVASGSGERPLSAARGVAVATALAIVATACGGGGTETGASTSAPSTSNVSTSSTAPTTAAPTAPTAAPTTAAATSTPPTSTAAAPTTTSGMALAGESPLAGCSWTEADSGPTLTFVAGGQLRELTAEGSVRCLSEIAVATGSLTWAPTGARALVDDGVVVEAATVRSTGAVGRATGGWTWPTGLRFVQATGDALSKVESDGSGVIDISFLDDHRAATYHPDGLHLAVAGSGTATAEWWIDDQLEVEEWTQTGLFLVRNDGSGEQVWIDTFDAEITEVVFSADGTRLSFVADHGASKHIHSFDLPDMIFETDDGERILTALPEDSEILLPQYEGIDTISHLTIDPFDPTRVLFAEGSCAEGRQVGLLDVEEGGYALPVATASNAVPVGFLGPDRVAVLEHHNGCDGRGALWVVDLNSGDRVQIHRDVDAAAVRWQAPDLRLSLQDIIIAGFA